VCMREKDVYIPERNVCMRDIEMKCVHGSHRNMYMGASDRSV
jgi:hypothetical protein